MTAVARTCRRHKRLTEGELPEKSDTYSDESVKNPIDNSWRVGGAGACWPKRALGAIKASEAEKAFTNIELHSQERGFNNSMNSSTRTEIGGVLIAMRPAVKTHIGAWETR